MDNEQYNLYIELLAKIELTLKTLSLDEYRMLKDVHNEAIGKVKGRLMKEEFTPLKNKQITFIIE